MAGASDVGSKRLIALAPDAWVRWVTGQPALVAEEIVTADFQWVSRESDVLVRVVDPDLGHFLVLSEIQLRYDPRMPRRMQAYAALAEEKFGLLVFPVLVNILPPPRGVEVVERYESTLLGLQSRRDYRVLNLWEIDARVVLNQPLATLLPFVPVLRGGQDENIIRQALTALRADAQLGDLEPLLAFFATFVLDTQLVQQIMRWDMIVLEESPWYIELDGRSRYSEARRLLTRTLELRFGAVPRELALSLDALTLEQLRAAHDVAVTAPSLVDFEVALPAVS